MVKSATPLNGPVVPRTPPPSLGNGLQSVPKHHCSSSHYGLPPVMAQLAGVSVLFGDAWFKSDAWTCGAGSLLSHGEVLQGTIACLVFNQQILVGDQLIQLLGGSDTPLVQLVLGFLILAHWQTGDKACHQRRFLSTTRVCGLRHHTP